MSTMRRGHDILRVCLVWRRQLDRPSDRFRRPEQVMHARGLGRTVARDFDADAARAGVELFDPHRDVRGARMRQHGGGDLLGQRLDQRDVPARRDHADRIRDHVVGEHVAHVGSARRPGRAMPISTLKRTLCGLVAFARIGADPHRQYEVVDEDAVERILARIRRIGARGREPVVDLRGLAPCAPLVRRDLRADAVDRCGIELERQNVRIEQQKARNVGRLERACEACHHSRARAPCRRNRRAPRCRAHRAGFARRSCSKSRRRSLALPSPDRVFLDAVFGQHDSKDVGTARQRGGGFDDARAHGATGCGCTRCRRRPMPRPAMPRPRPR